MSPQSGFQKDLTGKRFGRLVVLEFAEIRNHNAFWKCQCDCGNITVKQGTSLSHGYTKSCGCLVKENCSSLKKKNKKHKCSDRKLMSVWRTMIFRCESPKSNRFYRYGGRGIKVCDEWHDVDVFADWALANGYRHGLTIERLDKDGMYCPENCSFVTQKEQSNNRSSNVFLEYNGERRTIANWSEITGIPYGTLSFRIKNGWRIEDALTVPVSNHNNNINRRNIKRSDDLLAFQS